MVKYQFAFDLSDLRSNANFMQRGLCHAKIIELKEINSRKSKKKNQTEQWKFDENRIENIYIERYKIVKFRNFLNSQYEYTHEWVGDVITSLFFHTLMYIQIWNVGFLLKHVKARPHIKIYRSKHYFAFIQGGYKESFTFSYLKYEWKIARR